MSSIALGIAACAAIAVGIAYVLSRREESQSKSPLEQAVKALPTSIVSVLTEELQIATYPAFAAVEAVRFQGARPSNYSTTSKNELKQKLTRAVEDLSGAIQYVRLYNALELTEFERKPEQVLHDMRESSADARGVLPTLAGIMEYQLSPPEREELARVKTQQIVSRNRRVLLDLAAAETVLKQGRDLLTKLETATAA